MKATRLHLLRHGQVVGFEEMRYNGQNDIHLTAHGRKQSAAFAGRLQHLSLGGIYSSDLYRCRVAADQIALLQNVQPVYMQELRELHIGDWQGKTWMQLQQEYPELWQARLDDMINVAPPSGESLLQMAERVRPAVKKIVADHPGEEIVLVGHGGVNRVILLDAIGAPLESLFHIEQDFGCENIIDFYADGSTVVKKLNT
ncbi:alpha-ribazole phosphatase [Desulfuromusa kysingii]|uniref:Alpha-ribazole phosphatase n=1 Tax=Desulfuromusa kysingii TaxID=37625 RepID=A0A1H4CIQ2_9BACT|nr:histidine phosphatase family protein [Desulfuromusa kysingii]SEA60219.1 alpha-ribazole phosphatase [Desulfuromusa kysingii]